MPGCDPTSSSPRPAAPPWSIEAEYVPARTVEPEATSRLGLEMAIDGRVVEAAIALRYPAAIGDARDLNAALSSARLSQEAVLELGDPVAGEVARVLTGRMPDNPAVFSHSYATIEGAYGAISAQHQTLRATQVIR